MKKLTFVLLLGLVFLLVGCADDPVTPTVTAVAEVVETATRPQTATPIPSSTFTPPPSPTATATATNTATPTSTPSPTATPLPTATATATATQTPTPTPVLPTATARPASLPASGPAPSGPNLLANPGFENRASNWEARSGSSYPSQVAIYSSGDYASFIHSGTMAAPIGPTGAYFQRVSGVIAGQTYRAGGWVKIWSSTGEDRTLSENPGDFVAQICINTFGDDDPALPTTVCSGFARPIDAWQYISVDAVATNDRITILIRAFFTGDNRPKNNIAIWDDMALGTAPAAATPTPLPPSRPAPIPFNATALRDNMVGLRSTLEQLGGFLDRVAQGQGGTCVEFQGYYVDLITIPTYNDIPAEWQAVYNDYLYAADHGQATNEAINTLCESVRGTLTALNYGVARMGVNESLDRLNPAINAANGLLGQ